MASITAESVFLDVGAHPAKKVLDKFQISAKSSSMMELPNVDHITDPEACAMLLLFREMIVTMHSSMEQLHLALEELQQENANLRETNAKLRKMLFSSKSERIKPVEQELKQRKEKTAQEKQKAKRKTQEKRRKNKEKKHKLPTEQVRHKIIDDDLECEHCGGMVDALMCEARGFEFEYTAPKLLRIEHIREKKKCECGQTIVTAPAPPRVGECAHHGPGLHAHVVVSKCEDSIPIHRQSKQLERVGMPISPSTLGDMFARAAQELKPLWQRLLEKIRAAELVNGDETKIPVQQKKKTRTAWMWTFIAQTMIGFVFSFSRSGDTPSQVLGQTTGHLQVDGYTGYNKVCVPEGRERVGCWAHARRKFFEALPNAPEAQKGLDLILDLYQVEYDAAEQKCLGSEKHLAMRILQSQEVLDEFYSWVEEERESWIPKSGMGQALGYAWNQREALSVFLTNPNIKLDNNIAEGALRSIALGRKNFLFVGNDQAGENLAILQSLTATCVANGVNPQDYLSDVLIRIQSHPQSKLDELLPQNWQSLAQD